MMEFVVLLLSLLIGYMVGSVPFGFIFAYLAGVKDIRRVGSGNVGATNVLRIGHRKMAILTLILDMGKGMLAVMLVRLLFDTTLETDFLAGIGALLGHIFPLWLRFRGGKGVATAIGLLFVLSWPVGVGVCVVWLLVAAIFRYSSLAALVGLGMSPLLGFFVTDWRYALFFLLIALVVSLVHWRNIQRLLSGQEDQIKSSKIQQNL